MKKEIIGEVYLSCNYIPDGFRDLSVACVDIDPVIGKDISLPKIKGTF